MATTETHLQAKEGGELAFSLVVDGYNYVATTTSDTAGIATAFASTDWTNVKSGLDIIGQTSQSIDPFQPQIKPDGLAVRVLDVDGTLARLLLGNPSTVVSAPLKQTVEANHSSILARAGTSTGFPSSGTAYLGHEAFTYTSITSGLDEDTFSGTVRGKWSLFGTDSGDRIGQRHVVQHDSKTNRTTSPEIRSVPHAWYNRMVGLVLHHAERTGSGARSWATATLPFSAANAKMLWVGRIKAWSDDGAGWISIQCTSVHELLTSALWLDQYQAQLHEGTIVYDKDARFEMFQGGTTGFSAGTTLSGIDPFVDAAYRYDEIIGLIQGQFSTMQPNGTLYAGLGAQQWGIDVRDTEAGPRVMVEVQAAVALSAAARLYFGLSPAVASVLGFGDGTDRAQYGTIGRTHGRYEVMPVDPNSRTLFRAIASEAPKRFANSNALRPGDYLTVIKSEGSWAGQPSIPADAGATAEGFISVGDRVFAVTHNGAQSVGSVQFETFVIVYSMQPATENNPFPKGGIGIEAVEAPVTVRQVWREVGSAGEILLKILLSTGAIGYNHATYDVYSAGFGLGVPCDLVDVESFEALDVPYELLLDTSESFGELLEEVLAVFNRHLIFEDGQLRLTPPGFDAPSAEAIELLTEDSKASPMDRSTVVYGTDGIINRIKLLYTNLQTAKHVQFRNGYVDIKRSDVPIVVADQASESDYGHRRELEIKARGILDPDAWARYVAYPAIAYFSRPMGLITRSISPVMFHLVPGDICKITDDYLVDPLTGERGVSGLACWVRSVSIDWTSMAGQVELVFLPYHPVSQYALISPSALLDSTYSIGDYDAGYDAVAHKLKLVANTFGRASDADDISFFAAGDSIQVKERSPANPAAPVVLTGTVLAVDETNHELDLAGALSGIWDATLSYVVEAQPYATASTEQRAFAIIGDDVDQLIEDTAPAKLWAGNYKGLLSHSGTVDYGTEYIRPSSDDATDGEPLSARKLHDLVLSLNNLLAYKTRNVLVNDAAFPATRTVTSTNYTLVWGPAWVPLHGTSRHNSYRRPLLGKVRIKDNGTGTASLRVVSSPSMVSGSSNTALRYSWLSTTVVVSTSSATVAWLNVPLFESFAASRDGQMGTWITVELKTTAGGSAAFSGFALVEAPL